jgi:hypothetical protein
MKRVDRPFFLPHGHPMQLGKYGILTAPIFRLYQSLCQWMLSLKSGCIVYGVSRIGKTYSIDVLTKLLKERFADIAIFTHDLGKHDSHTEKEFFTDILRSFGHPEGERKNRDNAGNRFGILLDFMVEEAMKNYMTRVLFFIDEAQLLTITQYGYLRTLFNRLHTRHVVPTFVLIGDEKLYTQYKDTYENDREISGRFMNEVYNFRGIMNEDEVELALNGYDITEEPKGSGWSFTRYFFPTAFDANWRLTSQAKTIWDLYCEYAQIVKREQEIPMEHLGPIVQNFLTTFSDLEVAAPVFSRDAWCEALKSVITPAEREKLVDNGLCEK